MNLGLMMRAHLRAVLVLALLAGVTTLTMATGAEDASAHRRSTTVEFTKWVTAADAFPWPMTGVVTGGTLGDGTYSGQVDNAAVADGITTINAIYSIDADKDFSANVLVRQSDATGHAVIVGKITEGWRKGALVLGTYDTQAVCPIPTPGNVFGTVCFEVTLHIFGGAGH
jgi:hypothetical protein